MLSILSSREPQVRLDGRETLVVGPQVNILDLPQRSLNAISNVRRYGLYQLTIRA